jgi:hypothetical protein
LFLFWSKNLVRKQGLEKWNESILCDWLTSGTLSVMPLYNCQQLSKLFTATVPLKKSLW